MLGAGIFAGAALYAISWQRGQPRLGQLCRAHAGIGGHPSGGRKGGTRRYLPTNLVLEHEQRGSEVSHGSERVLYLMGYAILGAGDIVLATCPAREKH